MNGDESIFVELTNFEAKKHQAFEEIVKLIWNEDKQKTLGRFEEIVLKIKEKYRFTISLNKGLAR